jgi:hypothetical protein
MRIQLISILALATFSAHAGELPERFDYPSQVGVAEVNVAAYGCLTIANDTLQVGEIITLINPADPLKIIETRIRKKLSFNCSRNAEFPPGASFYSFRIGTEPMAPSIAVIRFNGEAMVAKDTLRADLNGDGIPESFRSCTSNEGIHLSVWSGEPLRSLRVWHTYYYLGYDVTPSCTSQEYGE